MIDIIDYTYTAFKVIADKKKFFWQMDDSDPDAYTIWGYDLPTKYVTKIIRNTSSYTGMSQAEIDQAAADVADFEANYKAGCNRPNTISPTAALTQFIGKTIELAAGVAEGYCEWSFDQDTFISKVMPMPIDAQKGDTLDFEIWVKPGVMGPDAVKVGQYGFNIPIRGSYPMGWIYGSGGGEIKSYCTVRCYYRRADTTVARDFNVIAEFLV
jgi:hypothetical protein